jgi:hypothetical protein
MAHLVASLLKRWLLGTYQGAVRPHQLDYYLDEFNSVSIDEHRWRGASYSIASFSSQFYQVQSTLGQSWVVLNLQR